MRTICKHKHELRVNPNPRPKPKLTYSKIIDYCIGDSYNIEVNLCSRVRKFKLKK